MDRRIRLRERVTTEEARKVLKGLRQTGQLAVILGMFDDRIDALESRLRGALRTVLMTSDEETRAKFQAEQGAVAELEIVRDQFEELSRDEPPPEPRPEDLPDEQSLQDSE